MLRLNNSVAVLALIAFASTEVPRAAAQDPPAASPAQGLDSLVNSLSPDTDEGAAIAGDNLPEEVLFTDEELDGLVAPVALYPDALLAQVLVASTYPLQIVKADRIVAVSEDMTDEELSETLSEQEFDPSVLVLLSGFPTVVGRMAEDLDWTERLGIAMLQQDDDVLAAVQRMRADARDMGYLSSNDAQTVEEEDGQIYVAPADPEVVYVPTYDPSVVYTSPAPAEPYYVAPAQSTSPWSAQSLITGGVIGFGTALLVDELWGDDDDEDDNDWDGYWGRPRPIAWQDREFYPRPYWNRNRAEQARAWSWERDRYWRRSDDGWRREAARERREAAVDRRDALGYLGASPEGVRNARERGPWRDLEARERRERAADERQRQDRQEATRDRRQERDSQQEAVRERERRQEVARERERTQEKAREDGRRQEAQERERRQEVNKERERQQAEQERDRREKAAAEPQRERPRTEDAAAEERSKQRAEQQRQRARAEQSEQERRRQPQAGDGQAGGGKPKAQQGGGKQQAQQGNGNQQGEKDKRRCRGDDKDCK